MLAANKSNTSLESAKNELDNALKLLEENNKEKNDLQRTSDKQNFELMNLKKEHDTLASENEVSVIIVDSYSFCVTINWLQ